MNLARAAFLLVRAKYMLVKAREAPTPEMAKLLLDEAEHCVEQAKRLIDCPRWLGMTRTGWQRLQALVGVVNAWNLVNALSERAWGNALICAATLLVTACWRLPPKGDPDAQ